MGEHSATKPFLVGEDHCLYSVAHGSPQPRFHLTADPVARVTPGVRLSVRPQPLLYLADDLQSRMTKFQGQFWSYEAAGARAARLRFRLLASRLVAIAGAALPPVATATVAAVRQPALGPPPSPRAGFHRAAARRLGDPAGRRAGDFARRPRPTPRRRPVPGAV